MIIAKIKRKTSKTQNISVNLYRKQKKLIMIIVLTSIIRVLQIMVMIVKEPLYI